MLDLSRSPLISALSAASVTVGYLMVGLPAGVLVDRVDPWRVLVLTDALSAGLFAALFGFAAARALAVWLVLVISFAAGACSVFRVLFLAVDPVGVVLAGTATSALGGDPRPVFLAAGTVTALAAAAGWLAGLRRAGHGGGGART